MQLCGSCGGKSAPVKVLYSLFLNLLAELNCNILNYSSTPLTVTVRLSGVEV
jgi:hypothetical protein